MRKILHINSFFSVGGPPAIVNGLYLASKEYNYECKIAAVREKVLFPIDSVKIGNELNTYIYAFLTRVFDCDGFYGIAQTKKLIKFIKEYQPDIIHLHNLHGYSFNLKVLFNFLSNEFSGKIIWTLHDCWTFTGHCSHFISTNCYKWKNGCKKCPQKMMYPKSILFDRSKSHYLQKRIFFTNLKNLILVTPSNWLKNFVEMSFLNKYKIITINNGIDTSIFSPLRNETFRNEILKKYNKKYIVLAAAVAFGERKGIDDVIKIYNELNENYQLVLIGEISKKHLKLMPNVIHFNKIKKPDKMAEIYSIADVFINPTKEDVYSNVNMESIACGTPVITYDSGGAAEMINKNNGIVINNQDYKEMIKQISNVCERKIFERDLISKEGRKFDKNYTYKKYFDLYNK